MEDESDAKVAPATRLRRRLSVEQSDDTKSTSAPNTPTKKRGTRRAAKPDLDLIDENVPENDSQKKLTKKTNMKELEVEDRPMTPSRRSARIKSNTSIILETTQAIDSPRAKRASRRNSQVGSDNEAPVTPARATRRTRKDSANTDKVEPLPSDKLTVPITEVIIEEPEETSSQKSQNNSDKPVNEQRQSSSGVRKSPRLSLKKNHINHSPDQIEKESNVSEKLKNEKARDSLEFTEKETDTADEHNKSNKENKKSEQHEKPKDVLPFIKLTDISSNLNDLIDNKLSISNVELLNKMNTEPTKKQMNFNKSSSALVDTQTQCFKHKRHRAKSLTTLSEPVQNENKCYSDSESIAKSKKNILSKSNNANSQDVLKNVEDNLNLSGNNKRKSLGDVEVEKDSVDSSNSKQKLTSLPIKDSIDSTTTNLFDKEPTNNIHTLVYIEESDSNPEKTNKQDKAQNQYVPIVHTNFDNQETSPKTEKATRICDPYQGNEENVIVNKNDSCEPMDIDETIPDNTISNKSLLKTINVFENKVSSQENDEINYSGNGKDKSTRSSLTLSTSQTLDKTENENKSTLVLSPLKDISNETSMSQSPQINTEKKFGLNSDQALHFTQGNEMDKKNLSLNCLTSTPLQQKSSIKHVIQVNTSGLMSENNSKIDDSYLKASVSNTNKSNNKSEELESHDESSSQDKSNFVDDEADDANDDYESGDSRDDEEKQYEREHEIVQKGETLTSEVELSNDSDYEKNSFVVSSDAEDYDLLDGSGDDLCMNDNDLKMTSNSKKKYNERMMKEQKEASREMFMSRHKLHESGKNSKSNLPKKKKNLALLESSDSEVEYKKAKITKYKRMRLDSSHETSINKSISELNMSLPKPGSNENYTIEAEMTVTGDDIGDEIDPLIIDKKKKPNTPQKGRVNKSIEFINSEHSEKKEDDIHKSEFNVTVGDDPLEDSNTSGSSDSSTNVHIENYDSVLNDLNKSMKTKKNKKGDISLNIDKKPKEKSVPIVDQLNLTGIKLNKKKEIELTMAKGKKSLSDKSNKETQPQPKSAEEKTMNKSNKSLNEIMKKSVSKKKSNKKDSDNESSVSIDLHLLFSEESNNSEDVEIKDKEEQSNENDSFIPLKKSRSKMDIVEMSGSNDKSNTGSSKKIKKKNRTLDKSDVQKENSDDETEVQFILDKTGTHNSTGDDKLFNISGSKEEKENHVAIDTKDSDSDAPMEVSNKSVIEAEEQQVDVEDSSLLAANKSENKTPKSDKKRKRIKSLTKERADVADNESDLGDIEEKVNRSGIADKSVNKSMSKTPKSEKKKAKRMSQSQTVDQKENVDSDAPMEMTNNSVVEGCGQQGDIGEIINTSSVAPNKSSTKTPKSDKKKKRTSESQTEGQADFTETQTDIEDDNEAKVIQSGIENKSMNKSASKTPKSEKKKSKRMSESRSAEQNDEQVCAVEVSATRNESTAEEQNIQDNNEEQENERGNGDKSVNKSAVKSPKSDKKKKKLTESQPEIQTLSKAATETENLLDTSSKPKSSDSGTILENSASKKTKTSSSEKKKTKKALESNDANNMGNIEENKEVIGSKKRKRKSSLNQIEKERESEGGVPCHTSQPDSNISITAVRQNKKRKISHNVGESANLDEAPIRSRKITALENEQNVEKQRHTFKNQVNNNRDTTDMTSNKKNGTIKRKVREDDEGNKIAKVLKADSGDKMKIPRLPASVLNQLEDKPTKKIHKNTKSKAISTTNFAVEITKMKKTKPSNYLEESIYINEESASESKKQKYIKIPKVLPFLPTASTSNCGYTTNFKVNILPKEIKFVAKSTNVENFKDDYLQKKRIKRMGTYELYKRNRTVKMSKF